MSAVSKGVKVEKAFCEGIKRRGFVVDKAERSLRDLPIHRPPQFCGQCHKMIAFRISAKHDTFGMFDVIAKHKEFADYTFYFQIKKNRWTSGKDRIAIEDFPRGNYDVICMVRKMDRKPFDLRVLSEKLVSQEGVHHMEKVWIEHDAADFLDKRKFMDPSSAFQKAVTG